MDGSVGEAATQTLSFADALTARLSVPVFTQDERLTSYEADQQMQEQRVGRKERRKRSDETAAMIILRDYLSTSGSKN
jgi:putative Holliday junction resolvase